MTDTAIDYQTGEIVYIETISDDDGRIIEEYRKQHYICTLCNAPVKPFSRSDFKKQKYTEHFKHTGSQSEQISECPNSFYSAFRSTIKYVIDGKKELPVRLKDQTIVLDNPLISNDHSLFDINASYLGRDVYLRLSYVPTDRQICKDKESDRPVLNKLKSFNIDDKLIIEVLINESFCNQMRAKHHKNIAPEEFYLMLLQQNCGRRIVSSSEFQSA